MNEIFAIVIHGGAGNILKENMTPELEKSYEEKLSESLNIGYAILEKGGSATDAVVAAIKTMENSPLFNAGKGAVFTHNEKNEMDAAIMEGKELNAGAIAGVSTIKNPIEAARLVMEKSQHVMLSGKGAEEFAELNNIEIVNPTYFFDEKRYLQLQKIKNSEKTQLDHSQNEQDEKDTKFGTVGAVALDKNGNITAGTSTGGMTNKKYGRIGDSPIVGAGTYANNNTCGVSCTGHGEYFIRKVAAYDLSALMAYKEINLIDAANYLIHDKMKKIGGDGGLIALDKYGNIAMPFNTFGMFRGLKKSTGELEVKLFME
ncbi:MAG: isoaspartyl peptidase/L-asparaginase [Flavobacteriales bacterium]|nr:isoaspartyl peptidase/L-asparaginase [Flavobacteriales bacterium]MCB9363111.1 isoaspartyl peptidase/L-asparaginase [Flavobacteriales bacterium]